MSERLGYHTVEALEALSLDELRALWELVPTERQRAYRAAYDREMRAAHAEGSDERERKIALALLKRYEGAALVPVGSRWARAPRRVQEAARRDEAMAPPQPERPGSAGRPSLKVLVVLVLLMVVMAALFLGRGGEATDDARESGETALSADATLTPLALEAQDEVIGSGDTGRAPFYPVNLQIRLADDEVPRVWAVQRRVVRASEWNYDLDPDVASYLNGMSVRPIIGIPWSEDNAAWFARLVPGAEFRLQMNTGAILTYRFEERREVRRSDTGIFRQVIPGLVVLLLGERDAEGFPTATRTLVTAAYPVEQELERGGELVSALVNRTVPLTPTPSPTLLSTLVPFSGVDVQVIRVTTMPGALTAVLRLYNGGFEAQPIRPDDIWLALGYTENPAGPRLPAETLPPFILLPSQAADLELTWPWANEPYATLDVGLFRYGLEVNAR